MKCNVFECPFLNEIGYCKLTCCIRRDLADKYNRVYTTDRTTLTLKTPMYTHTLNETKVEVELTERP